MNTTYNVYERGLCALCLLTTVGMPVSAQQIQTPYFMQSPTARTTMNPTYRPERGYVSIPVLDTVGASYGTNGIAVDNLIYPKNSETVTFMDSSVNIEPFLNGLKDEDQVNMNFGTQVLSGGWYTGKGLWTVDVSIKGSANIRAPKTSFEFMKKGNGSQSTYDIRNIRAYAEAYLETGVGYSRPITGKLTVGGKIKSLRGVGSMDATIDRMHAEMGETSWEVASTGALQTSMKGLVPEIEVDEQGHDYYNSSDFDPPGLSGFGMGVGLGATHQLTENIMLFAAVLDLGSTSWSKGGSTVGKLDGTFNFNGFDLAIGENNGDIPSMGDQFDAIKGDFENLFHFRKEGESGSTTRLRSTINVDGEYRLLESKLGIGLLSGTRLYSPRAYTELALSGNYRPVKWFEATLSYSFIHSKFKTYGIALNSSLSWVSFLIGSDYMLTKVAPQYLPVSGNAMNLYMEVSVPLKSFAS